ncbi:MAG: hypothetical protein HPY53_03410 [Brevinematales bacterium]|nr:hypothetical protein [Brevinematales bacterium]
MEEFSGGVKRLESAIDEERNGYMEWHDGPDYSSVSVAATALTLDERPRAAEMLIRRLDAGGYTVYLGYAVVELGKDDNAREQLKSALERTLDRPVSFYDAANIARNILELGPSAKAVEMFRRMIREGSDWYTQVDTLVNLKSAIASSGKHSLLEEVLTPELADTVLAAVRDDDYLTRYHAAELMLKAAGVRKDLSEHKELFPLICGSNAVNDDKPTAADREGFEKAVGILREIFLRKRQGGK